MMNPAMIQSPYGTPTGSHQVMNEINQFLLGYGGPVLFAIVFAEQAGLPFPAAPWLLAAGALSATGKLSAPLAIAVTALGAVMADSAWFYVGRRGGQRVLRLFCRLSLSRSSCVERTKGFFARHGLQALMAAKFLPGLGAVMPPLAGALGMRTGRFLLFDGLGSLFYSSFYIVAGFVFHNQLEQAVGVLNQLGFSALLLALILVTGYIAFKYIRRRNLARRAIRQKDTANEKVAELENAMILTNGPHLVTTSSRSESLNRADIQNVASARLLSNSL
jgi:membrane protein DedA with SNARE-associated domain